MKDTFFQTPDALYSCERIKFSFEHSDRPYLEITLHEPKKQFIVLYDLQRYQLFDKEEGKIKTQFAMAVASENEIILQGNIYNALQILKEINLVSAGMYEAICADADLMKLLESNRNFELFPQRSKLLLSKKHRLHSQPTEIIEVSASSSSSLASEVKEICRSQTDTRSIDSKGSASSSSSSFSSSSSSAVSLSSSASTPAVFFSMPALPCSTLPAKQKEAAMEIYDGDLLQQDADKNHGCDFATAPTPPLSP